MVRKFDIDNLHCLCSRADGRNRVAYILYPMDILSDWIGPATERYGTSIVVITGIDWQDALSPWPAKGVPRGCPDFKGLAPEFLSRLQDKVIPQIEASMGFTARPGRTLVGVSMSGLFALWQWMQCDTFDNIASLSGSFWYDGFVESLKKQSIPHKNGHAYFLLGDREARSKVKAFDTVAADTQAIIALLDADGINTRFESVPGNHYADPIGRLDKAFAALGEMS